MDDSWNSASFRSTSSNVSPGDHHTTIGKYQTGHRTTAAIIESVRRGSQTAGLVLGNSQREYSRDDKEDESDPIKDELRRLKHTYSTNLDETAQLRKEVTRLQQELSVMGSAKKSGSDLEQERMRVISQAEREIATLRKLLDERETEITRLVQIKRNQRKELENELTEVKALLSRERLRSNAGISSFYQSLKRRDASVQAGSSSVGSSLLDQTGNFQSQILELRAALEAQREESENERMSWIMRVSKEEERAASFQAQIESMQVEAAASASLASVSKTRLSELEHEMDVAEKFLFLLSSAARAATAALPVVPQLSTTMDGAGQEQLKRILDKVQVAPLADDGRLSAFRQEMEEILLFVRQSELRMLSLGEDAHKLRETVQLLSTSFQSLEAAHKSAMEAEQRRKLQEDIWRKKAHRAEVRAESLAARLALSLEQVAELSVSSRSTSRSREYMQSSSHSELAGQVSQALTDIRGLGWTQGSTLAEAIHWISLQMVSDEARRKGGEGGGGGGGGGDLSLSLSSRAGRGEIGELAPMERAAAFARDEMDRIRDFQRQRLFELVTQLSGSIEKCWEEHLRALEESGLDVETDQEDELAGLWHQRHHIQTMYAKLNVTDPGTDPDPDRVVEGETASKSKEAQLDAHGQLLVESTRLLLSDARRWASLARKARGEAEEYSARCKLLDGDLALAHTILRKQHEVLQVETNLSEAQLDRIYGLS